MNTNSNKLNKKKNPLPQIIELQENGGSGYAMRNADHRINWIVHNLPDESRKISDFDDLNVLLPEMNFSNYIDFQIDLH